jgi:signal transduction histidine kinase
MSTERPEWPEAQIELSRLAEERAALRRVASLVAGPGVAAHEIFAAVAEEVAVLLRAESGAVCRYEPDDSTTVMAYWSGGLGAAPRSTVGAPVVVEGRVWGTILAGTTKSQPFPDGTESRIMGFSELVAAAISSAVGREQVAALRARIVAAVDEARRLIGRNLHDGLQQQLVTLSLALRSVAAAAPPDRQELRAEISQVAEGLTGVLHDLREISQGLHPAILSEGGLGPALRMLARRSAIRVELEAPPDGRLPEQLEVAVYYVVSEALTNAAKHARASVVRVAVEQQDGVLDLSIRDDGAGGADPGRGSGLIGLRDRVEAMGGTLVVESPVGAGTSLHVALPVRDLELQHRGREIVST